MLEKTRIFAESWNVAWRVRNGDSLVKNTDTPFTVIKNSYRYWAADPFLFENGGEVYVFAELYDYILRRGIIGYYQIKGDNPGRWIPVITEPWHLSYPFVIRQGVDIYILPEANASGRLYAYKALRFPDRWERVAVIRDGVRYADTTPFACMGRNFALAYQIEDPNHPEVLLLDLDDSEKDRKLNISDVKRRRPAGGFFEEDGKLIRPAQNCTDDYGKGLVFYCVCADDDGNYQEHEICSLGPEALNLSDDLYLDGMHTYNISTHYEVVDIKTRRFNLLNLFMRFAGKLLG